jgi:single-strand DNA-binding protein
MNTFVGIGNTVYELEGREVAGKTVANGVIAIKRAYAPDKVDFINFTLWGSTAEVGLKYCGKGSLIAITGEVQTQKKNETTYTKVNVTNLKLLQTKTPENSKDVSPFTANSEKNYESDLEHIGNIKVAHEDSDLPF